MDIRPSRRAIVAAAAGTALSVMGDRASAHDRERSDHRTPADDPATTAGLDRQLYALEQEHSARLGVFAYDTGTGRAVAHRADELFPMCSTFKTVAVAAVLRDRDRAFLDRVIRCTERDVTASGYAPVTGLPQNLADGMTVAALCAAALDHSDNTAANLLLRELGGPDAVTGFCRTVGDRVTRLDRWEPALNSAEPGRTTDTTTPRAIGRTYARLTLGSALDGPGRERLTGWMLGNTTGAHRLRAGLPTDWTLADKTGTGSYGTTNDVGITWPAGRPPIVLAVLSTKPDASAPADEPLLARTAALLAAAFGDHVTR